MGGGGFHPKWQILSDIAGPSKDSSEKCRGVQGVAYIPNLRLRLVVNMRTSWVGHLVCKTEN